MNQQHDQPAAAPPRRRRRWGLLGGIIVLGGVAATTAAGGSGLYFACSAPERNCLSCHEIQEPYNRWAESSHRNITCKVCHGGTFTAIQDKVMELVAHVRTRNHDNMALNEEQVVKMTAVCGSCHSREYAQWKASGHGVGYAAIFLDEKHNATEQIAGDCLRCHGMFFKGSVENVVEPISTKGPWRLKQADLAGRPVIPCLACHQVHVAGQPAGLAVKKPSSTARSSDDNSSLPRAGEGQGVRAVASASRQLGSPAYLYCRREQRYIPAAELPVPVIREHGRTVAVSPDPRQRVCVQCHAPNAFGEAGSGDDRTPRGVHEGLSCFACHQGHSADTVASCDECHPQFSHCGLDVRSMDTTFHSPQSTHNIHSVQCTDCHTSGIPRKKNDKKAAAEKAAGG